MHLTLYDRVKSCNKYDFFNAISVYNYVKFLTVLTLIRLRKNIIDLNNEIIDFENIFISDFRFMNIELNNIT
ncbi:hypothetical protein HMPREF0629_00453 [Peptoniphilus sp. oral taxon 386 str. F0131]|nr:hypothetical protein HMPREF0629_00453 [Peptoniphilus sp. oral taxon 386 str. F0131]